MRVRDESLRTGRLLAGLERDERPGGALIFLARGAGDIDPLTRIEEATRRIAEARELGGLEWHVVDDVAELTSIDPALVPSRVARIEAAELAMLSVEELKALLGPALERLAEGEDHPFPAAGGAVGSPAEGIQFLGRDQEIRDALDRLAEGCSLEILAPRRSGKTSLMRSLVRKLPEGWRGVVVNLEKELTLEDLAARLWVEAEGVPYRAAQQRAEEGWEALLATAVEHLATGPEVLVLFLDELVSFFQNQRSAEDAETQAALATLGALDEACRGSGVRLVTASSLPLKEYLREKLNLAEARVPELFRSLEALKLQPLDVHAPEVELQRVLLGTGLVPEAGDLDWLKKNVDLALPYPALRFLDSLASRLRSRGPADEAALDRLLEEFLDTTDAFNEFDSNLRRRGQQQAGGLRALRLCLDRLATAEPGAVVPLDELEGCLRDAERPAELIVDLIETFPVIERDGGLALASRFFRRWWRRQLEDGGSGS